MLTIDAVVIIALLIGSGCLACVLIWAYNDKEIWRHSFWRLFCKIRNDYDSGNLKRESFMEICKLVDSLPLDTRIDNG